MVAVRTTIGCSALIACSWPSDTVKSPGFFEKGGEKKKKKKTLVLTLGSLPEKGGKKTKKKKTLVLTLGRSNAYTANPLEKGEKKKKKKKPWV